MRRTSFRRSTVMVLFLASLLAVLLLPAHSSANGGVTYESVTGRTGQLKLTSKSTIFLDDELLHITLDGDYVDVHASYTLRNDGPDDTVEYAFPIDFLLDIEDDYGDMEEYYPELCDQCLPVFMMSDETGVLRCNEVMDPPTQAKLGDKERKIQRKWYVARLSFPAKSTKRLNVYYRAHSMQCDSSSTKSFFDERSDRYFIYSLSPSGSWGSGHVNRLRVIVDCTQGIPFGLKVLKIGPYNFQNYQGTYVMEAEDFDLQHASDLEVVYDTSIPYTTDVCKKYRAPKASVSSIRASSTLKGNYAVANLIDGDFSTAWVEGAAGNGEGEWVEFELSRFAVRAVGIANGFMKSEALYLDNARIKTARIDVTFTYLGGPGYTDSREISFPDRTLAGFSMYAFPAFLDFEDLGGDGGYGAAKTKVRVTILSVYPGRKWTDTCISEIYLLGEKSE